MAKRFSMPVDQWLKMLKQERGINAGPVRQRHHLADAGPAQAGRRAARRSRREELARSSRRSTAPAVRARLIAASDLKKANKTAGRGGGQAGRLRQPGQGRVRRRPSASVKGLIQPIRKHGGYKEIEQAAFNMNDGEVSPVIQAGGQYVILKREGLMPARDVKFEQVAPQLGGAHPRPQAPRTSPHDVFQRLAEEGADGERLERPGQARSRCRAWPPLINGGRSPSASWPSECIERHGEEVLEGTINRRLIEQAARRSGITVTEQDIDAEIARAASHGVKPKPDGSPDVEAWLKLVTKKQSISVDVYRHDAVWPSVALKKARGRQGPGDRRGPAEGFEANYGPRVRCRAIVLNNLRRAQQVWEMARKKPQRRVLRRAGRASTRSRPAAGDCRARCRRSRSYGGQPLLEKEAFALKPGELSGIIQVGRQVRHPALRGP